MKSERAIGLRRLLSSAALLSMATYTGVAHAQTPFTSITSFGESYADRGNVACIFALGPPNCPYPSHNLSPFNSVVPFDYKLQQLYGIPNSQAFDYASAGSAATTSIAGFSLDGQVNALLANGTHFGPSDLVAIQTLINDGTHSLNVTQPIVLPFAPFNFPATGPTAADTGNAVTDAKNEAARDVADIQKLVNVGLRNIAWLGPGDVALTPLGQTASLAPNANFLHTYYNTAFDSLQADLAPLAKSGVRIFLFDLRTFEQRLNGIGGTPQMYGFANIGSAFIVDGLHFTEAGFGLVARYMQNQIDAPTTVTPQGGIVLASASNFAESTFGHLDAYRNFSAYGAGGAFAAYAADMRMPMKALPAAVPEEKRWSAYGELNYAGGTRESQLYATSANFNSYGGTAGLEYQVRPDWKLGGVFSYAQPNVNLGVQNAHLKVDALQFGGYSSYTTKNWFADVLLAYGHQVLNTDRLGIIDVIHGSTDADLFTVAAKAGYLYDLASLRVGPIAGLNYTHASIAGYTETGDILLTQIVNKQDIDSLTGSAGIQVRLPFSMKGGLYSPFVNVTAEHDFLGDGRIVTTTQSTTLLLPVLTPTNSTNQTYGKVAAGIAAQISGNVSGTINGYTTFARTDGNVYGVNGGIKVAF